MRVPRMIDRIASSPRRSPLQARDLTHKSRVVRQHDRPRIQLRQKIDIERRFRQFTCPVCVYVMEATVPSENRDADRLARARTGPAREHQPRNAEDEGERSHEDCRKRARRLSNHRDRCRDSTRPRSHHPADTFFAASSSPTSSVITLKPASVHGPNEVTRATSVASRPRAIGMRPMRGLLWRASNVYQRPPR
jgi:hypothetical protein